VVSVSKVKGCAVRSLDGLTLYFYCSEWARKSCSEFSTWKLLVWRGLRGFPDVQGLDSILGWLRKPNPKGKPEATSNEDKY
jgi:hypothetical protein